MSTLRPLISLALALLVAACGTSTVTPSPGIATAPATPTPATSSAGQTPNPSESAATSASSPLPGAIVVQPCPATGAGTLCLPVRPNAVRASAARGGNVTLTLSLQNPGGTASAPVAVLLHVVDAASTLPLGQPACTTCSSTATSKVIGLEWPALAPGETRSVSVDIPVTGPGGTFAADLYARPLADVMADQIANGITPGQQTWTVDLAVSG